MADSNPADQATKNVLPAAHRLPNEVLDLIYGSSASKPVLKQVRLVSRAASEMATPALFRDMRVTTALTKVMQFDNLAHSKLAVHVKTLVIVPQKYKCAHCATHACLGELWATSQKMASILAGALRPLRSLRWLCLGTFRHDVDGARFTGERVLAGHFAQVLRNAWSLRNGPLQLSELTLNFTNLREIGEFCNKLDDNSGALGAALAEVIDNTKVFQLSTALSLRGVSAGFFQYDALTRALSRHTSHLTSLVLQFEQCDTSTFMYAALAFNNLRILKLKGFVASGHMLLTSLLSCKKILKHLELSTIAIGNDSHWSDFFELLSACPQLELFDMDFLHYNNGQDPPDMLLFKSVPWQRLISNSHKDLHACADLLFGLDSKRASKGLSTLYRGAVNVVMRNQYYWLSRLSSSEDFNTTGRHWRDRRKHERYERYLESSLKTATGGAEIQF